MQRICNKWTISGNGWVHYQYRFLRMTFIKFIEEEEECHYKFLNPQQGILSLLRFITLRWKRRFINHILK